VWSIWWVRRGNWRLAGLLGGLADVTKAAGVLVVVPLVWIARRERKTKLYRAASQAIAGKSYLAPWCLLLLAPIITFALVKRVRPEHTWFACGAATGHPALRAGALPGLRGTGPGNEIPHGDAGGSTGILPAELGDTDVVFRLVPADLAE
jgi:hypothetical protein